MIEVQTVWPRSGVRFSRVCSGSKLLAKVVDGFIRQKANEYDQEIPQSHTGDQPMAP